MNLSRSSGCREPVKSVALWSNSGGTHQLQSFGRGNYWQQQQMNSIGPPVNSGGNGCLIVGAVIVLLIVAAIVGMVRLTS